jgi:RES domain-containing protein
MRLWRLVREAFAELSGEGAAVYGGRWNSPGSRVVYTAAEAALAVLEVRVHLDLPFELLPADYVLMEVESGEATVEAGEALTEHDACRRFGDTWLAEQRSALLAVPSVIVPQSRNVLVNPEHPDAGALKVVARHRWPLDRRLF